MKSTRLHVIPVGDEQHGKLKLHAAALECWCHPIEKDDVVTHNAFDCREKLERQDEPTGKIWVHVLEEKAPEPRRVILGQYPTVKPETRCDGMDFSFNYGPVWICREPYGEQEYVVMDGDQPPAITPGTIGNVFGANQLHMRYPAGEFSIRSGIALLPGQMVQAQVTLNSLPNADAMASPPLTPQDNAQG